METGADEGVSAGSEYVWPALIYNTCLYNLYNVLFKSYLVPQQLYESFGSPDIVLVMDEARKLAILYRHALIDYAHLFIAIFGVECEASVYCKGFKTEKWKVWLQGVYPAKGNSYAYKNKGIIFLEAK